MLNIEVKVFIILAKCSQSIVQATMGIERKNNWVVLSRGTLGFQDSVEMYNCTHMEKWD